MEILGNKKSDKNPKKYYCEKCDYNTNDLKDYSKHKNTRKHLKGNSLEINGNKFVCNCGKNYSSSSGLWKHKQKCLNIIYDDKTCPEIKSENKNVIISDLILKILQQNTEFKEIIVEQNKTIIELSKNNQISNSNINSNNKSFNLQVFLNETCKNAMNIMDFANSIQLKLTDLENVGELGYIDGISKIIIDNLKLLDVTERPVHCSDFKRDVLYIKENNKWEKENENNAKIKKMINCVTKKNISLIPEWKQKYPECTNINSNKSTKINKMIMEIMETDNIKNEKIIKKIAKEVIIEK